MPLTDFKKIKSSYQLAVATLMTIVGPTEAAICVNNDIIPAYCCTSDSLTLAQPYSAQGVFISLNCESKTFIFLHLFAGLLKLCKGVQASSSATQFSCSGSRSLSRCDVKVV